MWQQLYQPPLAEVWQGRDDEANSRLFQYINPIDLQHINQFKLHPRSLALIGFCCDAGVKRNLGRAGAKEGPAALRKHLANLPLSSDSSCLLYDAGDIVCKGDDLESAQQALAEVIALCKAQGVNPVILGGGHEIAWGHYQGLQKADAVDGLGIINFDAHFDCRPLLEGGLGSSGTPFTQIANVQDKFRYLCLGIQKYANTKTLFTRADELGCKYIFAQQFYKDLSPIKKSIKVFAKRCQRIYLTICLDVFSQAFAPGVSAPQAIGLAPWHILPLLPTIFNTGKVCALDIAELSPAYDRDQQTARLGASLIGEYLQWKMHNEI